MQEVDLGSFFLDLEDAEELPMQESPWYVAIGGKAILIVMATR